MTTAYTTPTLTWYRSHGGYVNREGFGFVMSWQGRYVWQAPQSTVIEVKAKSCAEAKRMISGLVQAISVEHGNQWRGCCTACGTSIRTCNDAHDLAMAIIHHLRNSPAAHPQFVRYS